MFAKPGRRLAGTNAPEISAQEDRQLRGIRLGGLAEPCLVEMGAGVQVARRVLDGVFKGVHRFALLAFPAVAEAEHLPGGGIGRLKFDPLAANLFRRRGVAGGKVAVAELPVDGRVLRGGPEGLLVGGDRSGGLVQLDVTGAEQLVGQHVLAAACLLLSSAAAFGKACVWKVASGDHTLYLAGSVHALRGRDYPLPPEYDQAFQASAILAFETDLNQMGKTNGFPLSKAAFLPKGTTLRDHLDPRVYAYILKVIARVHGSTAPEKKLEHLKPWAVAWLLQSPGGLEGVSGGEGVEAYLIHKARQANKPTVGLVPLDEHIAVFGGMNDADSQTYLLLRFIQLDQESKAYQRVVSDWKRGDIAGIDRSVQEDYRDAEGVHRRLITDRNRRWVPEIL